MKSEFEALINSMREQAERKAEKEIIQAEVEVKKMRANFKENPPKDFVASIEKSLSKLIEDLVETDSYLILLSIPEAAKRFRTEVMQVNAQWNEKSEEKKGSCSN